MKLVSRLAAIVSAALVLSAGNATVADARPPVASYKATAPVAPPLAQALARRLHFPGTPILGDRPEGYGGPWALWLTLMPQHTTGSNVTRQRDLAPAGRVLSTGPSGAQGTFQYFDLTALPHGGRDSYGGKPIRPADAIRIARAWLRTAGVPIPAVHPKVAVETPGSTIIGGTGLCCFTALDVVYFGGTKDQYGLINAPILVDIADAGTVVQADVSLGRRVSPVPTRCADHTHRDANGVLLGNSCFDYQVAAGDQMTTMLGGHQPWMTDPKQVAGVHAYGLKLVASPDRAPLRVITKTSSMAIYSLTARGATYRFTLAAAFPGLPGSVWRLVNVQRTLT
jgi:hypothetical protein